MPRQDEPVGRNEHDQFVRTYEARHAELRANIERVESDLDRKLDAINSKVDQLKIDIARQGLNFWKLVATGLGSALLGYIADFIQHYFTK